MEARGDAVVDTCLCIDIWHGGILPDLARLPVRLAMPDVVAAELKKPGAPVFVAAGLAVESATPDEVALVGSLVGVERGVSVADLFALAMAELRGLVLLTGDRRLRSLAESRKVTCHGVLWVLDQLVPVVDRLTLAAALESMQAHGARLPADDCARRLHLWRVGR